LTNNCIQYLRYVLSIGQENSTNWRIADLFAAFYNSTQNELTFSLPIESIIRDTNQVEGLVQLIEKYLSISVPSYTIDFSWGLSSGEESMLRIFSSLFHVLDGAKLINAEETLQRSRPVKCDSLILVLDEADLTLHPEWQRRLIHILTAFLPAIFPASCIRTMQVVLSTHSPLLLGDFPYGNVTYLSKKRMEDLPDTFGQNIHLILKQSFFLSSTMGEFATQKIKEVVEQIQNIENGKTPAKETPEAISACKAQIALVSPGIVRAKLESMLASAEEKIANTEQTGVPARVQQILSAVDELPAGDRNILLRNLQGRGKH